MADSHLRAGIYARVSLTDKGQDPEMQLREMREFCGARAWAIDSDHVIIDHGWSGSTEKRPGLVRLMELCRRRAIDVVVVYRFDRFARSLKHLLTALEEFQQLGIQFVSRHEQLDTTTALGRLLFQVTGAFSEFERELIRERVYSGLANAREKGIQLGRPRVGQEKNGARRLVDPSQINGLVRSGASWSEIERQVGISRRTLRRIALGRAPGQKPGLEPTNVNT